MSKDCSLANEGQRREMKDSLLRIWRRIRDELAFLQDQSSDEFYGQVINPISGLPCFQNTSCAALVFATEYIQTGNIEWLSRARLALESLKIADIHSGLDEPKWNRLGWHYNKGSLFTTGTTLDAFWKTLKVLDLQDLRDDDEDLLRLFRYLDTCKIRPGLFAHDSIRPGQSCSPVQNTTAIAAYLMEMAATRLDASAHTLLRERDIALRFLVRGQRPDGFWPYIYPGVMQRFVFRLQFLRPFVKHIPLVRRYFFKFGDSSIFFGDAVHHCLVLYYLTKSAVLREPTDSLRQAIIQGWKWISKHLVRTQEGSLRFDFDWEPTPSGFRYCNFRDTSTYFLILALLPHLAHLGIIEYKYHDISSGLLAHIESALLEREGTYPSIKPYEGPPEVIKFILPRVGEASAWKGALLAEYILMQRSE